MRTRKPKYRIEFIDGMDGETIVFGGERLAFECATDRELELQIEVVARRMRLRLRPYRRGILKDEETTIVDFGDYNVFAKVTDLTKTKAKTKTTKTKTKGTDK